MTPQELKASILQLAIQGKLVPQIPDEGSGEELYQQIQAEKQRLIKAGKIKKEKPLPEIAEDEIPFDVPENWRWVRLYSVISLLSGSDLAPNKYNAAEKGIPYITGASNIEGNQLIINRWTEYPHNIARRGDLLLTCKGTVGKTTILNESEVHIARQLMAITPLLVDTEFLKYFVESQVEGLKSRAKSMIPGIERDNVLKLLLPLPPLAEQKRIVAKVEELLPLVERYEQAWSRLEEFNKRFPVDMQKSILQMAIQGKLVPQLPEEGTGEELFQQIQAEKQRLIKAGVIKKEKPLPEIAEDEIPFDIPESWKWVKLGDVLREVIVPMRDKPTFSKEGVPWCRIEDRDGYYLHGSKSNQLVSDETIRNMNLKVFPVGTVLSACTGGSIGTIVINTVECCTNQTFNGLVCSSGLLNWYLFWYLKTQFNALRKVGTGTTIAYVSQKKSKEMLLPLPPLAEQKRIVAKLEEILPLCERLK